METPGQARHGGSSTLPTRRVYGRLPPAFGGGGPAVQQEEKKETKEEINVSQESIIEVVTLDRCLKGVSFMSLVLLLENEEYLEDVNDDVKICLANTIMMDFI